MPIKHKGRLTAFARRDPNAQTLDTAADMPLEDVVNELENAQLKDAEPGQEGDEAHQLGDGHQGGTSPEKILEHKPPGPLIHNALFDGSQLGESFMQSGRSTPYNLEDLQELDDETVNVDVIEARGMAPPPPRATRALVARSNRNGHFPEFSVGVDGSLTVVKASQRGASNMRDGFEMEPPRQLERPESPRQPLPMREVKIHRGLRRHDREPSVSSRASQQFSRSSSRHRRDEEEQTYEEVQVTPKAPKTKIRPVKSIEAIPTRIVPREKKRRRADADYDDKALSGMSYTDLDQEPFDHDPALAVQDTRNGHEDSLEAKLEKYGRLGDEEQKHMFAALSINDWEASGDWFVEQFTDLMGKLKTARQEKRKVVQEFEAKAAAREEAVRLMSVSIDRRLVKMKQDGLNMMGPGA